MRDAHLRAMVTFAEEAEPEVRGHDQALWLDRLDAEMDNLRAALEWSQDRNKESCLRLASALWRFLDVRGHLEDFEWLPKALALTEGSEDCNARPRLSASRLCGQKLLRFQISGKMGARGCKLGP